LRSVKIFSFKESVEMLSASILRRAARGPFFWSCFLYRFIDIPWQDPAVVREKISAYHKQAIRFFHDRNIRISMDDFGSGYSSLNSLKDILFDEVKIDKHFLSAGLSEKEKI